MEGCEWKRNREPLMAIQKGPTHFKKLIFSKGSKAQVGESERRPTYREVGEVYRRHRALSPVAKVGKIVYRSR